MASRRLLDVAVADERCTSLQGIALPPGTQFIPMIFRASDATEANLKAAKSAGAGIVLGFNEPNEKAQADNTVAVSPGHLSGPHPCKLHSIRPKVPVCLCCIAFLLLNGPTQEGVSIKCSCLLQTSQHTA